MGVGMKWCPDHKKCGHKEAILIVRAIKGKEGRWKCLSCKQEFDLEQMKTANTMREFKKS